MASGLLSADSPKEIILFFFSTLKFGVMQNQVSKPQPRLEGQWFRLIVAKITNVNLMMSMIHKLS